MGIFIDQVAGAGASRQLKSGTKWTVPFKINLGDAALEGDPSGCNLAAYRAFANFVITQRPMASGCYWESFDVKHIPESIGLYDATVSYSPKGNDREERQLPKLSFSTKTGTSAIDLSIVTKSKIGNPNFNNGVAPDFKNKIGGNEESNCQIKTPTWGHNVSIDLPDTMVTQSFLNTLYNLTGKVNSGNIWFFAPSELLFTGCDGQSRQEYNEETEETERWWTLNFSFEGSPTVTRNIAPFGNVTKRGFDYVWTMKRAVQNGNIKITIPAAIYVEQVYEEADFSFLKNLLKG